MVKQNENSYLKLCYLSKEILDKYITSWYREELAINPITGMSNQDSIVLKSITEHEYKRPYVIELRGEISIAYGLHTIKNLKDLVKRRNSGDLLLNDSVSVYRNRVILVNDSKYVKFKNKIKKNESEIIQLFLSKYAKWIQNSGLRYEIDKKIKENETEKERRWKESKQYQEMQARDQEEKLVEKKILTEIYSNFKEISNKYSFFLCLREKTWFKRLNNFGIVVSKDPHISLEYNSSDLEASSDFKKLRMTYSELIEKWDTFKKEFRQWIENDYLKITDNNLKHQICAEIWRGLEFCDMNTVPLSIDDIFKIIIKCVDKYLDVTLAYENKKFVDLSFSLGQNIVLIHFNFLLNSTSAKILITTREGKTIDEKIILKSNNKRPVKFNDLPYGKFICTIKLFKNNVEIYSEAKESDNQCRNIWHKPVITN